MRQFAGKFFALVLVCLAVNACTVGSAEDSVFTRIAFGSCADQKLPQPIWKSVLAYKPDAFLFLGDNVYGDVASPEMTRLKNAYAAFGANAGLAALRTRSRVFATWDDHDYGRNDAGAGFSWRRESEELFLDFWEVPQGDPRRRRDGVYFADIQGPPGRRVQTIVLDTRFFRSDFRLTGNRRPKYRPDSDPSKTMLGDAQWKWLEAQLRKPADLRLVVSSIQVLAESHGWERWGQLPRERRRLFRLIGETGASGVIFLSGDRHLGALYVNSDAGPYPFYEITSSSLNRPWRAAGEFDARQLGTVFGHENFGTIDIDWRKRLVSLSLRDMNGHIARNRVVRLNALKSP